MEDQILHLNIICVWISSFKNKFWIKKYLASSEHSKAKTK